MLESDYWRLPIVVNKSIQWQKKKEYLELELDQVSKDIASVKRKLNEHAQAQKQRIDIFG